jgi:hypothetical protein
LLECGPCVTHRIRYDERLVSALPTVSVDCALLTSLLSLGARPSATCPKVFCAVATSQTVIAAAAATADKDALKNLGSGG